VIQTRPQASDQQGNTRRLAPRAVYAAAPGTPATSERCMEASVDSIGGTRSIDNNDGRSAERAPAAG